MKKDGLRLARYMDVPTLESLILRAIRERRGMSRGDLSVELDIARSTAGRRVDSLIERGLLRESGVETRESVGRPRRFLEVRPAHGGFIGIDFDARRVFGALVDFSQEVVSRRSAKLPEKPNAKNVLRRVTALHGALSDIAKRRRLKVLGTGLAVPGKVNRKEGIAREYPYIAEWSEVDLRKILPGRRESFCIENNTRAAALGEYWFGPRTGVSDLLCLNVRTGVSAAVIANGELIAGWRETAGEISHWPAWNPRMERVSKVRLEKASSLQAICEAEGQTFDESWKRFREACARENREALGRLRAAADLHGGALAIAMQLTDPRVAVLSGWFAQLGEVYLGMVRDALVAAMRERSLGRAPVELSALGDYSGALGAAALAMVEYLPQGG